MPSPPHVPPRAGFYDPTRITLDESVGYLMRRVMSSIRTQADAQLSSHDLTYAQWLPLFKISRCNDATVASLVRETEQDPASMTRALDRLESKGLVLRERSTTDRRVVKLKLTPEGQEAAARVPAVLSEVLNGHLSGFSNDEWRQMLSLLHRMLANGDALRQSQQQQPATPSPQEAPEGHPQPQAAAPGAPKVAVKAASKATAKTLQTKASKPAKAGQAPPNPTNTQSSEDG
jgi:DNA-binding MarR family transcriptional regulator